MLHKPTFGWNSHVRFRNWQWRHIRAYKHPYYIFKRYCQCVCVCVVILNLTRSKQSNTQVVCFFRSPSICLCFHHVEKYYNNFWLAFCVYFIAAAQDNVMPSKVLYMLLLFSDDGLGLTITQAERTSWKFGVVDHFSARNHHGLPGIHHPICFSFEIVFAEDGSSANNYGGYQHCAEMTVMTCCCHYYCMAANDAYCEDNKYAVCEEMVPRTYTVLEGSKYPCLF